MEGGIGNGCCIIGAIGAAGEGFEPFSAYTNRVPEADGVTAYKIEDNENNKKSGKNQQELL